MQVAVLFETPEDGLWELTFIYSLFRHVLVFGAE